MSAPDPAKLAVLGVDLGYGPDVTTILTVQDGRIVQDVSRVRVLTIRRPWKLTGRAATRARGRRRGRR